MNATKKPSSPAGNDGEVIATFALLIDRMQANDNDGAIRHHESLQDLGWAVVPLARRRRPARSYARHAIPTSGGGH
jgi:hypothetical protein